MQSLEGHGKERGLYSKRDGKSLDGAEQGSNMV